MAFSTEWHDNFCEGYDLGRLSGNARPQRMFGGAALICVAFACAFTLWTNLTRTGTDSFIDAQPRAATASNTDARSRARFERLRQARGGVEQLRAEGGAVDQLCPPVRFALFGCSAGTV